MIQSKCETCSGEFSHYPSAKRKYCKSACVPANIGNKVRWKDKKPVSFTCSVCAAFFTVRPSRAERRNVKYCSYRCHQIGEGRKGGTVTGEIKKEIAAKQPGGPKSYPKIKGRHAHRIAAEQKLGRALLPGEVVHHDDENRQNFSFENLIVLPNQSEHMKVHRQRLLAARKEKHGY